MDKSHNGRPQLERLQFARLRSLSSLPSNSQANLRGASRKVGPYEVMYVGAVAERGESYILLSDPYYVPISYFDVTYVDYSNQPGLSDEEAGIFATPNDNDTRVGRLDDNQCKFLTRKLIAYWTRLELPELGDI